MKKESNAIYGFAVVLGIFLSRQVTNRYGGDGRATLMLALVIFHIIYTIISIYKRKNEEVIKCIATFIPMLMLAIGLIVDKLYISVIGLILVFTVSPLIIKKFNRN